MQRSLKEKKKSKTSLFKQKSNISEVIQKPP